MQQRIRYHVIDWIRGLALINMIAYHTLWDIAQLFPTPVGNEYTQFMFEPSTHLWQQSIGFTFLFVSGFCFCFGSKPLIRGTQLVLWGALISIVTFIVLPHDPVRFGVLTALGFGTLLLVLIHAWFRTLPRIVSICATILSLLIFTFMHDAQTGVFWGVQLPQWLYRDSFTALLGFPPSGFISSDYYPIIPFFFVMLAGYFAYRSIKGTRALTMLTAHSKDCLSQSLEWIGRHSLIIYLLHQVVIFAIVRMIVFGIFGL